MKKVYRILELTMNNDNITFYPQYKPYKWFPYWSYFKTNFSNSPLEFDSLEISFEFIESEKEKVVKSVKVIKIL